MTRKVLVALARAVCRDGLRRALESITDVTVVGEADDGRVAVRRSAELRPDIVFLEPDLPGLNGTDATRQIVAARPEAAVIALAVTADPPLVAGFLRAGVRGFVLTDGGLSELERAIEHVADGHVYLSPSVEDRVISSLESFTAAAETVLTPREREVLQLLAEGQPTRQIAEALGVSTKTIETHRARIMEKLGIRSVAGLTKYAIRNGITSLY